MSERDPILDAALSELSPACWTRDQAFEIADAITAAIRKSHSLARGRGRRVDTPKEVVPDE